MGCIGGVGFEFSDAMILLGSSLAIAWLVSDLANARDASFTRRTLLACSIALCVMAKQCEAFFAWLLTLHPSAFRLHLQVGPILGNVIILGTFALTGFLHARRRLASGLTCERYLEAVRESVRYVAPAALALFIFASTAALFILATLDRIFEVVTGHHFDPHSIKEWRLLGALYLPLISIHVDVQRRCVGSEALLPTNGGKRARLSRRIDANGCIVQGSW